MLRWSAKMTLDTKHGPITERRSGPRFRPDFFFKDKAAIKLPSWPRTVRRPKVILGVSAYPLNSAGVDGRIACGNALRLRRRRRRRCGPIEKLNRNCDNNLILQRGALISRIGFSAQMNNFLFARALACRMAISFREMPHNARRARRAGLSFAFLCHSLARLEIESALRARARAGGRGAALCRRVSPSSR